MATALATADKVVLTEQPIVKRNGKHGKPLKLSKNFRPSYQKLQDYKSYPVHTGKPCDCAKNMAYWVMMYKLRLPADMPQVKCDRSYVLYASMKRKDHPEVFQTKERDAPVTINEDYVLLDEILKTSP